MDARMVERLRRSRDPALAVGLALLALIPPDTTDTGRAPGGVRYLLLALATLPLALRARFPLPVLATVATAITANGALGFGSGPAWFGLALAAYTVTASHEPRVALAAVATGVTAALAAPTVAGETVGVEDFLGGALLLALPTLLGDRVFAARAAAQAAARDERETIARELHDSVAHALSVIVVQADAADAILSTDPDRARTALAAIRETGRTSLADMRRLVVDIRSEEGLAPLPGLSDLPALVAAERARDLDVELVVAGPLPTIAPSVDLTVYRIVQESLTNVRRHARASRARVELRLVDGRLHVEVADDGRGAAAAARGQGLVGMQERAGLCGGTLHAGNRPDGGWHVVASLPVGRP
ncbi:sensor histidine kinase [Kineosporia sp. A_224]|uniref:sensor histidine kinase n=1 Tax=Kineosporia sp. A_224 TaxID=1962180 RepID=UPI000B4A9478|nr:histidine kinase [Kineosporia sp. A_224]